MIKDIFSFLGEQFEAILSVAALLVAIFALWTQRRHDRISLKPLASIVLQDFDDNIRVKVSNAGVGPMIITQVITEDKDSLMRKGYPIEWFEEKHYFWDNFNKPADGKILAVGDELVLLHYSTDELDGQGKRQREKDIKEIRFRLKDLRIIVHYKDIYNVAQPIACRDLAWFGRKTRI